MSDPWWLPPLREYPESWKFTREDAQDLYVHGFLTGIMAGCLLIGILLLVIP